MRHEPPARPPRTPFLNLPPVTKAVAAAVLLVFVAGFWSTLRWLSLVHLHFDPAAGPVDWIAGALTYGLVHGDTMHLVGNLLGLVILGPLVERRHGAATFLLLLLIGAFGGALAHTATQSATGGSAALIGASASVAALIGWSLRQIHRHRGFGRYDQAVTTYGLLFIVFNLIGIVAFNDSPTAYAAHVGGFAAGWLDGGRDREPARRLGP